MTWICAAGKSRMPPAWSKSRWVSTMWRTSSGEKPSRSTAATAVVAGLSWTRSILARTGPRRRRGCRMSPRPTPVSIRTSPSGASTSRQWQTRRAEPSPRVRPSMRCPPNGHIVPQLRWCTRMPHRAGAAQRGTPSAMALIGPALAGDGAPGGDLEAAVLLDVGQEHLHDLRVELRAAAALELAAGDVVGEGLAVGAVGGHRVVGVGDGDDPADHRDVVAHQPLRVTGAVPGLMVTVAAGDDVAHERDRLDDPLPLGRVRAEHGQLLGGQ